MPVTAIVGAQFGDEGKGKITDLLAQQADMIIRFQGGNNAGHTVVNEKGTFKLHLVPSGIFNSNAACILGAGTVVDLIALSGELDEVEAAGVSTEQLYLSERAHLVLPWHVLMDQLEEQERGAGKIGTTKKGVGPAYADKVMRNGIQAHLLRDPKRFKEAVLKEAPRKLKRLAALQENALDVEEMINQTLHAAERLHGRIVDTLPLVEKALQQDARILLEGQLGAMRDLDWGIYPYVTGSNPLAGYATIGAGIPARAITRVIGVVKAYSSAVGAGPFPTEIFDEPANKLRELGHEYGATTGRPRRVGWFDAVVARYAHRLNWFTEMAVTKVDVLDSYGQIPFGVSYQHQGNTCNDILPTWQLEQVTPNYEQYQGWETDVTKMTEWAELPEKLHQYLSKMQEHVGAPVGMLSVGPERDATLIERRKTAR